MFLRALKLAAPLVAGLGVMAATAPASAQCYNDGWRTVCPRPPVVYAPPPVYYAPPPVYVAPAPRVVVAPAPYYRPYRHYGGYYGRPTVSFGLAF